MALAMNKMIEFEYGVTVAADPAYIRIDDFSGNKKEGTVYLNTYLNKQAADDEKLPIEPTRIIKFPHDVSDNAPNIVKQGYEYLKTLTEFSGASDV